MPGVDLPKDPTVTVTAAKAAYYLVCNSATDGANFNKNIFGYSIETLLGSSLKDADGKDVAGVYVYTTERRTLQFWLELYRDTFLTVRS